MKKLAAICLLILASIQARADLVVTQLVETGGQAQPQTRTIKLKGAMMRSENGSKSIIMDTSSGDLITINNDKKTFMKIPGSVSKAMTARMQAMSHAGAGTPAERPKPVDTGKQEKVKDYDTEIYTAESPVIKFTYWVCKDFPNGAVLKEQMKKIADSLQNKVGSVMQNVPDTSILPGVVLKTQMVMAIGPTVTTTLVSVKETPVDDSEFQVPAGYTEVQMPHMPGAPGGAPNAAPAGGQ